MIIAAIYCRVSTDKQESEGSSLDTQLAACIKYCQDKGYKIDYQFIETYSGLSLERTELDKLRELLRSGDLDIIVIYSLDRWTRDPTHGVILQEELEKHKVALESVTETIETTELGKLISYVRGFSSKLEAEKIRERTMRGKKAKARLGLMQSGGFACIYGYDYIHRKDKDHPPKRVVNEKESQIIKKIFAWMVDDHESTYSIAEKLRITNVPTKRGGRWAPNGVRTIVTNPVYTGQTFAFLKSDKIELPGATPALIPVDVFQAAQRQLKANKAEAKRNMKREYLLRGFTRCEQCGHPYYGRTCQETINRQRVIVRRYACCGKLPPHASSNCKNKSWNADYLEARVWAKIDEAIEKPEIIIEQIRKRQHSADNLAIYQDELKQNERKLKGLDRDQQRLLDLALKGFPDKTIEVENKRINSQRTELEAARTKLQADIEASKAASIDVERLNEFIKLVQKKIANADFKRKRLALEMLGITVWIDGPKVHIKGSIDVQLQQDDSE